MPRSESGYGPRPNIELPSFGVVGDYVNSVVIAVLDMLTVWQYREGEERCSEKFLCSAGLQSVRRSLLVPGLITSLSSLAISWALDDTNTILAARSGFLGQVLINLISLNLSHLILLFAPSVGLRQPLPQVSAKS